MPDDLDQLLTFDPLAAAEDLTGISYKEDDGVTWLGMGLAMAHNKRKVEALTAAGDSHYGITVDGFKAVLCGLGLQQVLELPFHSEKWGYDDTLYVFAGGGLLARFDTYFGGSCDAKLSVNSANIYYNWRPSDPANRGWGSHLSSGGWYGFPADHDHERELTAEERAALFWSGAHDAREGVAFNINRLRRMGTFLSPWLHRPHLWLCHYADNDVAPDRYPERNQFYDRIRAERIAMLPAWVREMIGQTG